MRKCVVGFSVALVVSCVLSGVSAAEVTREEFNALKEKVDRLELKLRKMEERLDGFQTARVQGTEASAIRDQARRVNENKKERGLTGQIRVTLIYGNRGLNVWPDNGSGNAMDKKWRRSP